MSLECCGASKSRLVRLAHARSVAKMARIITGLAGVSARQRNTTTQQSYKLIVSSRYIYRYLEKMLDKVRKDAEDRPKHIPRSGSSVLDRLRKFLYLEE